METEARKHSFEEHPCLAETIDPLCEMAEESESSSHVGRQTHTCKHGCKYSQVQIVENDIPNSEICQPGWQLARDVLAEYDKANGHRYAVYLPYVHCTEVARNFKELICSWYNNCL